MCVRNSRIVRSKCSLPDFEGVEQNLKNVLGAQPDIYNHNVETVKRLQADIRPQANYGRSLSTLRFASEWNPRIEPKSGIMLGLGEEDAEVIETLHDLYDAGARC